MDDVKKDYYDDISGKASTARSASHKYRSHKFKRSINEEVKLAMANAVDSGINLTEFYTRDEFKAFSPGLKKAWYEEMITRRKFPASYIAKAWGISVYTVRTELGRIGFEFDTKERVLPNAKKHEEWLEFIKDYNKPNDEEPVEINLEDIPKDKTGTYIPEKHSGRYPWGEPRCNREHIRQNSFTYSGEFDIETFIRMITSAIAPAEDVDIYVTIEKKN